MDARKLMPKQFIGGADVFDTKGKPITINATIAGLAKVKAGEDIRWAISFKGTERKLTLNATNNEKLIEMFGAETDDWTGKTISLYGEMTRFQGKQVQAVRIDEQTAGAPALKDEAAAFDPDEIPI